MTQEEFVLYRCAQVLQHQKMNGLQDSNASFVARALKAAVETCQQYLPNEPHDRLDHYTQGLAEAAGEILDAICEEMDAVPSEKEE